MPELRAALRALAWNVASLRRERGLTIESAAVVIRWPDEERYFVMDAT